MIGASKAGSSALHAYLAAHPQIAMSREKEPCFFVDQAQLQAAWPIMARRRCSHDWQAYLQLWDGAGTARYRGEASVYYAQAPHRSGVPARIAATCPDARIIYLVREPVSRAISHYWQRHRELQEALPLARALRDNPLYRDTSDYALQLQAYLAWFDPARIHVMITEDLRRDRRQALATCLRWLELPPFPFAEDQLAERHRSPPHSRRARLPLVTGIRDSALWAGIRGRLPAGVIERLRRAATVPLDKARVDDTAARAWLAEYLAPRRARFEAMIGRRIAAWDTA